MERNLDFATYFPAKEERAQFINYYCEYRFPDLAGQEKDKRVEDLLVEADFGAKVSRLRDSLPSNSQTGALSLFLGCLGHRPTYQVLPFL